LLCGEAVVGVPLAIAGGKLESGGLATEKRKQLPEKALRQP